MKIENRIEEKDEFTKIRNTKQELKFSLAWSGSLDWLSVQSSMIITNGKAINFVQENGRTKVKEEEEWRTDERKRQLRVWS